MKRALITGITGQDGSYLAELLINKGYQVFGLVRDANVTRCKNINHLADKIAVVCGSMANEADIIKAVKQAQPDEIYNLAAQSRPGESWQKATETLEINALAAIRLFEAVRCFAKESRVYHASSSEMFGLAQETPQQENTPFSPMNPYAAAKVYAHNMARIYRESYGLYIATGILFNHESERRPLHFVVQKVAYGAACAALGIQFSPDLNERGQPIVDKGRLALGCLDVARDWGYAPDFVQAMWMILQQQQPSDFVVGTGKLHTLRELCAIAYNHIGKHWLEYVITDPKLIRPLETVQTVADASRAKAVLGWQPTTCFAEMVKRMVDAQIERIEVSSKRFSSPQCH